MVGGMDGGWCGCGCVVRGQGQQLGQWVTVAWTGGTDGGRHGWWVVWVWTCGAWARTAARTVGDGGMDGRHRWWEAWMVGGVGVDVWCMGKDSGSESGRRWHGWVAQMVGGMDG